MFLPLWCLFWLCFSIAGILGAFGSPVPGWVMAIYIGTGIYQLIHLIKAVKES